MSIKSILCLYDGQPEEAAALDTGFALTKASRGALRILHVIEPPEPYPSVVGLSEYALMSFGSTATLEALGAVQAETSAAVQAGAERVGSRNGLCVWNSLDQASSEKPGAYFYTQIGEVREVLANEGRNVDLMIMGYASLDRSSRQRAVCALFEAGRPLLLVRQDGIGKAGLCVYPSTVCIAWDGSLSACRAVHEALPFMLRAKDTYIVRISNSDEPIDRSGDADIRAYLESHSIKPRFLHTFRGKESVGASLLLRAAAVHADLLIMGAFGRGQLTEALFGGVTEHVLRHTRLSVLLVH